MPKNKVKSFQIAEWKLYSINGIIRMNPDYTIFLVEVTFMQQELLFFIITTAITLALGIIGYFLKRTMDRLDKNDAAVQEMRENQYTLADKYATKAEVAEIKSAMQKLSDNVDYIKEHTTKNEDFIRVMTRLENKIDNFLRR